MNINDPLNMADPDELDRESDNDSAEDLDESSYVENNYWGFNAEFEARDDGGAEFLTSPAGHIGCELNLTIERDQHDDPVALLQTPAGKTVGQLPEFQTRRLASLLEQGWEARALLVLVSCSTDQKRFFGEVSVLCRNPQGVLGQREFDEFCKQMLTRIKGGDHPAVALDQQQFDNVVRSGGTWAITPAAKMLYKKGQRLSYKRRLSWSDRMVAYAMGHRSGCSAASIVFLAGLVALVVWLVSLVL